MPCFTVHHASWKQPDLLGPMTIAHGFRTHAHATSRVPRKEQPRVSGTCERASLWAKFRSLQHIPSSSSTSTLSQPSSLPFSSWLLNYVHNILLSWVAGLIKGKQTTVSCTSYTANDSSHGKSQSTAIHSVAT